MKLDEFVHMAELFDIYGALLTDRQRAVVGQYVNDDYSLFEIAEREGISRQGVRDALMSAQAKLIEYESRLALLERSKRLNNVVASVEMAVREMPDDAKKAKLEELVAELSALI